MDDATLMMRRNFQIFITSALISQWTQIKMQFGPSLETYSVENKHVQVLKKQE